MAIVYRPLLSLIAAVTAAAFLADDALALFEGMFIQALSIVAAVAFTAAFFFLQGLPRAKVEAIRAVDEARLAAGMAASSAGLRKAICEELDAAGKDSYYNGVVILILVTVFSVAVLFAHVNIPAVSWPASVGASKIQAVSAVCLFCFLLAVWATVDILGTAFYASRLARDVVVS